MPVEVAQGILNITPSMRGLQALIDREMRGADTRRAGREAGEGYTGGFGESAKKLTGVLAGAFAAVKIGDFAKDAISQASDLNEAGTKLQVVFGDATDSVNSFASGGAKALGQSKLDVQNAAATFGVYGKAAGLAGTANADFSKKLVGLSTDLASFYNTDPAQATEALAAGLRGESEPLRQYGILLDDATLRNKAFSMGLTDTTKNVLTPQQRVLAAQAVIMEQSTVAQGDFARTSAGLANQQRILSAQWTDMKGKLGAVFLPAVTSTVTAMNERLFPILETMGTKVKGAWSILAHGDFTGASAGLGEEDSPLVGALFKAHDLFVKVGPMIKEAWSILAHGDFKGGLGIEEDSPLVDLIFKVREFGLDTFDKLKDIFTNLWGTAKALWPDIKSIATSLSDAVGSIQGAGIDAFTGFLGITDQLSGVLTETLQPVLDWIAQFMRDNPAVVLTLVGALVAYKVIMQGITIATEAWKVVQEALNFVMNMNPIMKIVLVLTALAAAVVWAYTNVGWFRDAVDTAWAFIKEASMQLWDQVLKPMFTWIGEAVTNVISFFSNFGDNVQTIFGSIAGWIGDAFTAVIAWFKNMPDAIWGTIQSFFSTIIGWGAQFLNWLWDGIKNKAVEVFGWFASLPGWIWEKITALLGAIIGYGAQFLQWLWDGIKNKAVEVFQWFANLPGEIWNRISALGATILGYGSTFIGWIKDGIVAGAQGIWDFITGLPGKILDLLTGLKDTIVNLGKSFVNWIVDGVIAVASKIWDAITKALTTGDAGRPSDSLTGANAAGVTPGGIARGGLVARAAGGMMDFLSAENQYGRQWVNPLGQIAGPGSPTSDSIPTWLSNGEYVNRQASVAKFLPTLEALNTGNAQRAAWTLLPHLAEGGFAGTKDRLNALGGELAWAEANKKIKQIQEQASSAGVNLAAFNSSQNPSSFGWQRGIGMVPFSFGGLGTSVAGGTTGLWAALLSALVPSIPGGLKTLGGFENRQNVNNPSMASFHSYGLAMDVNAPWNPNGVNGYGRSGQYVIPSGLAHSLAARFGMEWGGDFTGTPDPMHFEIHLPPSAIGGAIAGAIPGLASATTIGGGFPAMVERWRATVEQSLAFIKQPLSLANTVLNQMRTESSGNENAINLTDINAQRGDPSIGLIQVIGATFRNTLKKHGLDNLIPRGQRDPFANLVAGELYSIDRYGSIARGMRGVAYAKGGIVPGVGSTDSVNALLTPGEGVLPKPQIDAYIAHAKALEAGFSGQMPNIVVNNYIDGQQLDARTEVLVDGKLYQLADAVDMREMQSL